MTGDSTTDDSLPDRSVAPLPLWSCLVAGVLAAVLGLLPWLITGMRLPLQNLWATEPGADAMPRALLPFSQYYLTLIAGLLVTGAAFAGVFAQANRTRMNRSRTLAMIIGLTVVQVAAIVQSSLTVNAGLQVGRASMLYLAALIATAALSSATAVLVAVLVASRARPAAMIGLAIGAILAGSWLSALAFPPGSLPKPGDDLAVIILPWVPAVLVGLIIAWGGLAPVGRVVAAVVALLALWIGPAAITAISSAAGSRVLARRPNEMVEYATEVFRAALTTPGYALRNLLVAVVVAGLGLVISSMIRRRRGQPT